jgi:hypothetical protein
MDNWREYRGSISPELRATLALIVRTPALLARSLSISVTTSCSASENEKRVIVFFAA